METGKVAVPSSIIIVGSGVFGLPTAYALAQHDAFAQTSITLIDNWDFEPTGSDAGTSVANPRAANYDNSRIIRSEYAHSAYAKLAREAHAQWRGSWGEDGRYTERKLLMCAQGSSLLEPKQPGEAVNYVKNAFNLSCQLSPGGRAGLRVLDSLDQIRAELRAPASELPLEPKSEPPVSTSLRGYVSHDSGWADSKSSIAWLRQRLLELGRVRIITSYVQRLRYAPSSHTGSERQVQGVVLEDGREVLADLVIVAAGSHTPRVLGMETLCDVYSELVAYVQLSPEECASLAQSDLPIIVNASRGVFAVSPDHNGLLKLGKCAHAALIDINQCAGVDVGPRMGADSPVTGWDASNFGWSGDVESVQDLTDKDKETLKEFTDFLVELFATVSGLSGDLLTSISRHPFSKIRRCYYSDPPSRDFIIDYDPRSQGTVFVAAGGSDHAFKFLPVIGEKVVGIILRSLGISDHADDDENLTALREAWRFPVGF